MSTFLYTALDKADSYTKGKIEANNTKRAIALLEKEGFMVINIKLEKASGWEKFNNMFSRISWQDKIFFTRHLFTMLESGIALDHAIKTCAEQTTNQKLTNILNDIYDRIQKGQTLHSSLALYQKYFSNFYVNLIRVGETSGKLDDVLEHLLEQQERDYDMRSKALGAMYYPAIIVSALIVMVISMILFVIPKITDVLTQYKVDLPLTTKVLVGLSNFLIHYGIFLIPVIIGLYFLFRMMIKKPKGKWRWDSFFLSVPRFNRLIMEFNLARFSRAMSALLKSGVPINTAMELAASVSNNSHYQKAVRDGIQFIQKGVPLAEVLKGHPKLYPPLTSRMIELGEKTGKLDHMLDRLAQFYEKSVENSITNLSALIEPLLMIVIGFMVAFTAVSVLTPIWKFSETI
jgi:type II secretory pathway component PulF